MRGFAIAAGSASLAEIRARQALGARSALRRALPAGAASPASSAEALVERSLARALAAAVCVGQRLDRGLLAFAGVPETGDASGHAAPQPEGVEQAVETVPIRPAAAEQMPSRPGAQQAGRGR
jgi:hypothetical protein